MYILVFMCVFFSTKQYDPSHYAKTHPHSILQVPTTQLAKISIDPKFVELTADVLEIIFKNTDRCGVNMNTNRSLYLCPDWYTVCTLLYA